MTSLESVSADSDKHGLVENHLKQIAKFLNLVHSKGLSPLLERTRTLAYIFLFFYLILRDTQKYLQQTLAETTMEISTLKSELTRAKLSSMSTTNSQITALEEKIACLTAELKLAHVDLATTRKKLEDNAHARLEAENQFATELGEMEQAMRHVQSQLEDQIKQRRLNEFNYFQAKESALAGLEDINAELNKQILEKEELIGSQQLIIDELKSDIEAFQTQLTGQENKHYEIKRKQELDQNILSERCENLQVQLKVCHAKLQQAEGNADLQNSTLTDSGAEIDILQAQLNKARKQMTSLESYHRDAVLDNERLQKDHKQEIAKIRKELMDELDDQKEESKLKDQQIQNLTALLQNVWFIDFVQKMQRTDSDQEQIFETVLREEIRAMKAAYEFKISKLKQAHSKQTMESNVNYRQMSDKLLSENRMLENKLKQYQQ